MRTMICPALIAAAACVLLAACAQPATPVQALPLARPLKKWSTTLERKRSTAPRSHSWISVGPVFHWA